MATKFKVISLEKNHEPGCYIACIDFEGHKGSYSITSDARIRYLDWIDQLSILNGFDEPFNGDMPYLKITGLTPNSMSRESRLEKALRKFIRKEFKED
jgi:hypothetical protein